MHEKKESKKHERRTKNYQKEKAKHLERLADKMLENDEKVRKFKEKKSTGKFLDLLAIKLDTATASNLRLKETNEEVKNSFVAVETQMMSFGNTLTSALILAADAFSNLAVQGETDMKKMASAALQAARQVVSAYIKEGVAGIVKNILAGPTGKVLGPFAIAVAGAAGAGASVLFNTLLNKVSAPALAQGGLATGPTMALVGDNRNARVDPEVIAPLSKLKSMMGDMGIGGSLETRISGNDLITATAADTPARLAVGTNGYVAPDMTILAEHISETGINSMSYQQEPNQVIWCVSNP